MSTAPPAGFDPYALPPSTRTPKGAARAAADVRASSSPPGRAPVGADGADADVPDAPDTVGAVAVTAGEPGGVLLHVLTTPIGATELRTVLLECEQRVDARTEGSGGELGELQVKISGGDTPVMEVRTPGTRCVCRACQGAEARVWAAAHLLAPAPGSHPCARCDSDRCPRSIHHVYRCRTTTA